jgi:hypothetical protein
MWRGNIENVPNGSPSPVDAADFSIQHSTKVENFDCRLPPGRRWLQVRARHSPIGVLIINVQ